MQIGRNSAANKSILNKERIIVALDVNSRKKVEEIVSILDGQAIFYKVGLQLYLAEGKDIITFLKSKGLKVFLDLKLHDIPNQVAGACREIVKMGIDMTTIHTAGGFDMMQAAVEAINDETNKLKCNKPVLVGVTMLTSLSQERAVEIGFNKSIEEQVLSLAKLAEKSGLDGVVASPQEISLIRNSTKSDFVIVTPGIRAQAEDIQDQKRVLSAKEALKLGSSYLVVGRPILKAEDPKKAMSALINEINQVSS